MIPQKCLVSGFGPGTRVIGSLFFTISSILVMVFLYPSTMGWDASRGTVALSNGVDYFVGDGVVHLEVNP
jgi:hypothetical protein